MRKRLLNIITFFSSYLYFYTGDNLNEYVISALTARNAQRSYPSSVFLFPNTDYWSPEEILITTPNANYTTRNYTQLFKDLNYTIGLDLLQDTQGLVKDIKAPGRRIEDNLFSAEFDVKEHIKCQPIYSRNGRLACKTYVYIV